MYMNCAVVNIIGTESTMKRDIRDGDGADSSEDVQDEDAEFSSSSAQDALSSLPDLYVANLAGINNCKVKETVDLVFDDPGEDVVYGKNDSLASKVWRALFRRASTETQEKSTCTGVGKKGGTPIPGDSSPPPEPSEPKGSSDNKLAGDDGQWHSDGKTNLKSDNDDEQSNSSTKPANCNDGGWHPECYESPDSKKQSTDNGKPKTDGEAKAAVEKAEDDAPKPISEPSKPGHRLQKPNDYYGYDGDNDDNNVYDYDIGLPEWGFHRQLKSRQHSTDVEEPTPVPEFDYEPDLEPDYEDYEDLEQPEYDGYRDYHDYEGYNNYEGYQDYGDYEDYGDYGDYQDAEYSGEPDVDGDLEDGEEAAESTSGSVLVVKESSTTYVTDT
jgi:hypothetical protein